MAELKIALELTRAELDGLTALLTNFKNSELLPRELVGLQMQLKSSYFH